MRVARLSVPAPVEGRPLQVVEVGNPAPGRGELSIVLEACGVCRTDLQIAEGDLEAHRLPIVPGHQIVGRVETVGPGVREWAPGDRVGVGWLAGTCGRCRFCTSCRENLCERAVFTGWDRDGGFAERVVAGAGFGIRLPDDADAVSLAPLLCGGVIGYRALRISGIEPGGRLGLYGFGASALIAIQVARYWNVDVYVVTRSKAEQRRALDLGAVWAGSYDEPVPSPLDAAVTFAPAGDVVVRALGDLDRGGVVAVNAIHLDRIPEFDYRTLWWERQLRSVSNFTRRDAVELVELAARIPITTAPVAYALERANQALADLKHGIVEGAAVLTPTATG